MRAQARSLGPCSALLIGWAVVTFPVAAQALDEASSNRPYRYVLWDVFTDQPLTGNPLVVFLEPRGMTAARMQRIARELAFSEAAFVFPAGSRDADFRVRIFGPTREFGFAGHPTIGTAFALARAGSIPPGTERVVFAEGIGAINLELEWDGKDLRFAWLQERLPSFGAIVADRGRMAMALGVEPAELAAVTPPVQEVSGGTSFLLVPLESRAAVDRVSLDTGLLRDVLATAGLREQSVYLFSTEPGADRATVYARKLGLDGREDPATGSAAGPLGCYLVNYGLVDRNSADQIRVRQGVRMERPGWLHVQVSTRDRAITAVRVGGSSVFVGEGALVLPD